MIKVRHFVCACVLVLVTFNLEIEKLGKKLTFCVRQTLLTSDWSKFSLRSLTQNIICSGAG